MKIDKDKFFEAYRSKIGRIGKSETVKTVEALLEKCNLLDATLEQTAYILATAYHEARDKDKVHGYKFHDFFPIEERGSNDYFIKRYWNNTRVRKWLGNKTPQDAIDFSGKGLAQVTGRFHFERLGIQNKPWKLLDVKFSAFTIVNDMLKGKYTGVKLGRYINEEKTDYENARRVVNGTDKASLISGYAKTFETILKESNA